MKPDQTYSWYVEATDGTFTTKNNVFSFTTIDVDLSWNDNSENEEGFKIYKNATGSYEQVGKLGADTTNFEETNTILEFGKHTCYEITSYNAYGESTPARMYNTINLFFLQTRHVPLNCDLDWRNFLS